MTEPDDYYRVLHVAPDASYEEIKRAYRKLARSYHPDSGPGDDGRMKELNQAWNVLRSPGSRAAYDAERAAAVERAVDPEPTLGTWGWGEVVDDPPPPPPPRPPVFTPGPPRWEAPSPASTWWPPPGQGAAPKRQRASPLGRRAAWTFVIAFFGMSSLGIVLGPLAVWRGLGCIDDMRNRPDPGPTASALDRRFGLRLAIAAFCMGLLECLFTVLWVASELQG